MNTPRLSGSGRNEKRRCNLIAKEKLKQVQTAVSDRIGVKEVRLEDHERSSSRRIVALEETLRSLD